MKRIPLSIPELAIIAGTRAAAGVGVGLLIADRLDKDKRRTIGWTLLAVGIITTIPIAFELLRDHPDQPAARTAPRRGLHV